MFIAVLITVLSIHQLTAQTNPSGWFFLSHAQKITGKWSYMTDVQLRSSSSFKYLQNVLIRPGLLYQLTEQQSIGMGYTYFAAWDQSEVPYTFEPENRIFEQYAHKFDSKRFKLNNRFRLEQRFIQTTNGNIFAQRFRHQLQARFFITADENFKKGLYINLQNEIFLNVQHKDKINKNVLDQNRPYAGIGYALNDKIEMEAGFYYRFQIEADARKKENIIQLMLITNL